VRLRAARLERRLFADILKVGLLSRGRDDRLQSHRCRCHRSREHVRPDALAGYGLASRLDYLLIPLLFALGTASVTMVGTNIGAGQFERARKIAWTAALISAALTGTIGFVAALFPRRGSMCSRANPMSFASAPIISSALARSMR
jgi:Na+-driven multidrug efflux pump